MLNSLQHVFVFAIDFKITLFFLLTTLHSNYYQFYHLLHCVDLVPKSLQNLYLLLLFDVKNIAQCLAVFLLHAGVHWNICRVHFVRKHVQEYKQPYLETLFPSLHDFQRTSALNSSGSRGLFGVCPCRVKSQGEPLGYFLAVK